MYQIAGFEERSEMLTDWKKWYPLLAKHKAPVKEIEDTLQEHPVVYWRVPFDDLNPWVATLPKDWPEMFSNVMGQVTCDELGWYLEDVEATLYALEKGWPYRGGF
jgi:hypothetical protein